MLKTYAMNGEYCRKKGLYKEQIEAWRDFCLNANDRESDHSRQLNQELKEEKKKAKTLEKDFLNKEIALTEAETLV